MLQFSNIDTIMLIGNTNNYYALNLKYGAGQYISQHETCSHFLNISLLRTDKLQLYTKLRLDCSLNSRKALCTYTLYNTY